MRKLLIILIILGIAILIPNFINEKQTRTFTPPKNETKTELKQTLTPIPEKLTPMPTKSIQNLRIQGGEDDHFEFDN